MSNKIEEMKYNKNTLELINNLTKITDVIIAEKDNDKIVIKRNNPSNSICYFLSFPKENFDFSGNKIGFYKFSEFYQILSCVENAEMKQDGNKIILSKDKIKINYVLSDTDVLQEGPKKVNFQEPDIDLKLTASDLAELEKMSALFSPEKIILDTKKNKTIIKLWNSGHDNSFEKEFVSESKNATEYKMEIASDIIKDSLLPKGDYIISIKKEGIIRFKQINDKADLQIFTAEMEEV